VTGGPPANNDRELETRHETLLIEKLFNPTEEKMLAGALAYNAASGCHGGGSQKHLHGYHRRIERIYSLALALSWFVSLAGR
jgi:hypothetical protein